MEVIIVIYMEVIMTQTVVILRYAIISTALVAYAKTH